MVLMSYLKCGKCDRQNAVCFSCEDGVARLGAPVYWKCKFCGEENVTGNEADWLGSEACPPDSVQGRLDDPPLAERV